MTLLRTAVAFLIAHVIAFVIVLWCFVKTEEQDEQQVMRGLQLSIAYDAVVLLLLLALLVWAIVRARRRANVAVMVYGGGAAAETASSMDLETVTSV